MQILSKDISIVIQGPISGKPNEPIEKQCTQSCIDNLRQFLPDAEIIVSTWEGSDVSHLSGYDILIFSEDPGAITYNNYELKNVYNNNNRQIVSTYNGLKVATKKYAIKYRADFRLENLKMIEIFGKHRCFYQKPLFKERIISLSNTARDFTKVPILNHICDLIQFGYTDDLLSLWDIPLQPEPQTTRRYPYETFFLNDPYLGTNYKMQYSPEQYIWVAFLNKKGIDVKLKYYCHIRQSIIMKSIIRMIDNFVIAAPADLGLVSPERLLVSMPIAINSERWLHLYNNISVKKSNLFLYQEFIKVNKISLNQMKRNFKVFILPKIRQKLKTIYKHG